MSRSGYSDDEYDWGTICWRGAVAAAIRGKRGQAFLLEMWRAMQSLPEPKLISGELADEYDGSVCALGSVGKARGVDMSNIDQDDHEAVASAFGISHALACEIMYMNDEGVWRETPAQRWRRMRAWISDNLKN